MCTRHVGKDPHPDSPDGKAFTRHVGQGSTSHYRRLDLRGTLGELFGQVLTDFDSELTVFTFVAQGSVDGKRKSFGKGDKRSDSV